MQTMRTYHWLLIMLLNTTGKHEEKEDKRSEGLKEYITGKGKAMIAV